jgi:hypothetical protein
MTTKKEFNSKERFDRAGRRIVQCSILSESETDAIASKPFLYSRIRARLATDAKAQEGVSVWSNLGQASWKAVPAMGLAAALSFGLFLYVNGNKSTNPPFSVDAYLGAGESGIENMLFAERRPLTADEVLRTIVSRDERETAR